VILEAFAKYLHAADPELPAPSVLARWLWERLSLPPETNVDRVLRCEISLCPRARGGRYALRLETGSDGPRYVFQANSESGERLLNSLYQYALSYEQQKWNRWVHRVKASDFNERHRGL
jgi:hypothetical protein